MTVSGQRLGKHVPAAMNMHATIVTVGNGVFSMWSAQRPFLGNSSVNTFIRQRTQTQQYKNGVFYVVRAKKL
jgi:hypothetical protein